MKRNIVLCICVFIAAVMTVTVAWGQTGPEPGTESSPTAVPAGGAGLARADSTRSVVSNAPSPGRPPGPPRSGDRVPVVTPATKMPSMRTSTNSNYLFSGEHHEAAVDLAVPGRGLNFTWARKYRSRLGPTTALGYNWDYSYNIYLTQAGFDLVLHDGNTREDLYSWNGIDRWTCAEFFRELQQNPDSTYTLLFPDMGRWNFFPFDATPIQGKLMSIADRNGNAVQFLYDGDGRLNMVMDTLGRPYTIAYNASGRIESITDFIGRQVNYAYYGAGEPGGSVGDLKSVTTPAVGVPPLGKTTTYTYTKNFADPNLNHDLLTVRDPKNQVYLQNVYAHTIGPGDPRYTLNPANIHYGRIVRQIWGNPGDTVDIFYVAQTPQPGNNFAVVKAIVNDRVGNVKEFFYDQGNRLVIAREYTGRAPNPDGVTTEVANRPTGKLRTDDPDHFDARYEYNADSQLIRAVHPNGNEELYTYDLSNPDRRAQGNLIQHCRLPGPMGGDQPILCESFEYLNGFGGCCGSFITRHVDFRGQQTLHDYDGTGNRIHTTHRQPAAVEDWEYNAFGQMTAHTGPDNGSDHRRRDENSYYDSGPMTGYLHQTVIDVGGFELTATYEYDPVGNVIRLVDPRGNDTIYVVNQLNQVVLDLSREVTPGSGTRYQRRYYYDANDNLVQVDVENRDETGMVQPNAWFTTLYSYDVLNYLLSSQHEVDEGHSIVTAYEFDANRNCTLMRFGEAVNGNDPLNTIQVQYDERDLPYRAIRAPGLTPPPDQFTTQFDYDRNANSKRTSQGLYDVPRVTERVHDGYDRLSSQIDAMGNVTSQHYDENGNRVSIRVDGELVDVPGSAGNVRLFEEYLSYDEMDRLIVEEKAFFDPATQNPISDGFAVTTTVWSPNSQVLSVTNDNGHAAVTTYDTANRPQTTTDAKGNLVAFTYDANSNETVVTETELSDLGAPPAEYSVRYTYDGLDRRIGGTNNMETSTTTGYDSRDNVTLATDGESSKNRYSHDGCDRRYNSTYDMDGDGEDIVLLQTWDDSSRLIEERDDKGHSTAYSYDPLNRLIRKAYADGKQETADYDVNDNTTHRWDTDGTKVTSFFDVCNRPTNRTIEPAPGVSPDTTFEAFQYDGLSRPVTFADDDSTVTRTYDSLSNITQETINGAAVTVVHDGLGNLLSCTYPGGREVSRTYDSLERVSTITDLTGLLAAYSYVGPAGTQRVDLGNGTRTDYTYDGILPNPPGDFGVKQIVGKRHSRVADGSVIDDRAFTWDRTNNKTSRLDVRAGGPGLAHQYTCDARYRLRQTVVTDPAGNVVRQTGYQLDGVGNRISVTNLPEIDQYYMDPTAPEPADEQVNQYTWTGFDYRQYDANGNLIAVSDCLRGDADGDFRVDMADVAPFVDALLAGGTARCTVDLNQDGLVDGFDIQPFIVRLLDPTLETPETVITYDYRNHMVEYSRTQTGLCSRYSYDPLGRRIGKIVDATGILVETRYFYLGQQVIEEQDAAGGTQATYVYGPHIDEVLTINRAGADYYYHADDLNSVMAVTDAAGAEVERYDYEDYGTPQIMDGGGFPIPESAIGNTHLFTGREYDPETGLYYYRTRYLDPSAGRFTSRDPIGIWGDAANLGNGYTYVGNNPATQTDPTGEQPPPPSPIPVPVPIPTPPPPPPPPPPPTPIPPPVPGGGGGGGGGGIVPPPSAPVGGGGGGLFQPIGPIGGGGSGGGGGGGGSSGGGGGGGGGGLNLGPIVPPPFQWQRTGTGTVWGPQGPLNCGRITCTVGQIQAGGQFFFSVTGSPGAVPNTPANPYTNVQVVVTWGAGPINTTTNAFGAFGWNNLPMMVWGQPMTTFVQPMYADVWYWVGTPWGNAWSRPCRIQ